MITQLRQTAVFISYFLLFTNIQAFLPLQSVYCTLLSQVSTFLYIYTHVHDNIYTFFKPFMLENIDKVLKAFVDFFLLTKFHNFGSFTFGLGKGIEPLYPPSYDLNSIATVLLQRWLWH